VSEELARLKRMLRVREGKSGYKANVEAIKAEIAKLEALNGTN
jgi:hypothetical protein